MSREAERGGDPAARLGPGALALVLGPSGVGKDALIASARELLATDPRFVFPERVVTRLPHAAESHGSMSADAFDEAESQGRFALTWQAHGLSYGIPVSIDRAIREGCVVVVNGSRTIGGAARRRYARASLILIDCPVEIRAARIAARGRERGTDIEARLNRGVATFDPGDADVRIDNSGTLAGGVQTLVRVLESLAHPA